MRKILFIALMLTVLPAAVFAQDIVSSTTASVAVAPLGAADPGAVVSALGKAFQNKDWAMLAGVILSALVVVARLIIGDLKKAEADRKIPKAAIPFIAAGISLAAAVGVGLQLHMGAIDIIKSAGVVAFVAIGGWEFASKGIEFIIGRVKGWLQKSPPAAPPPASPPSS